MTITGVANSHPVTAPHNPIVGVDTYNNMNIDPSVGPSILPDDPLDNFEKNSDRFKRANKRIGKKMIEEFIYTPQALGFVPVGQSTTLVPWGSIALRTEEKIYHLDDLFVSESEIRKVMSEELKAKTEQEVVWTESAGIIELGTGMNGTVALPLDNPLGINMAVNFGFDARGLLVYRIIKPSILDNPETAKSALSPKKFELPWNASSAMKLSKGTEIQVVGRGTISAFQGVIAYEGMSLPGFLGLATPGAAIYPVLDQEKFDEYSVTIIALDGKGRVRVIIEKIHAKSAGFTFTLMAGLISPTNDAVPQLGTGVLSYILQTAIENPLQNTLMNAWTVSINGNLSKQKKEDILYCFDLDLRNKNHHKAYKNLTRLNVKEAQYLAADTHSGVSQVTWKENKYRVKRSVDLKVFTERLALIEASKSKRAGKLIRPDNSEIAYRDKIYRKKFFNIFTGSKDIRWQSIRLKNNTTTQDYYAFFYQQLNRTPRHKQVQQFFSFAKALDICSQTKIKAELVDLSKPKKLFSSKDDININIELYFTQSGVENILSSQQEQGVYAYLKSISAMKNKYALFPLGKANYDKACLLFELYYYYKHPGAMLRRAPRPIRKLRKIKNIHKLKAEYENTIGRDFKQDFKLYLKARRFGALIAKWQHATEKHNCSKFFTRLGHSSSFKYSYVIAALSELAGRSNVLVHSLSMTGGGVSIKSIDEGKITHPRDEAWELVNRPI
jgi:hypothetical protein